MMSVIIRLQNLPLSANAANIRSFFQGLKIPDGGVNIVGGEDGDAFIAFATDDDARKAMLLNNQLINGVHIRLLLSSKQEMQTIITEAQNRVLKRSSAVLNNNLPVPQSQNEKRSYTLFNPQSKCQDESFDTMSANKMRIIDYSSNPNSHNPKDSFYEHKNMLLDEPPRPSEFSYKSTKPMQQISNQLQENDKNVYNYDNYQYGNSYDNFHPPRQFENENYDYNYSNDNYIEPQDEYNDDYFGSNEYYDTLDNLNYRKSLLPTPPVDNFKPRKPPSKPLNRYHDYTERPPWLEESTTMPQNTAVSQNTPMLQIAPIPQCTVVRLSLPFPLISQQTVLEIFKNISISPKRGIKIEIDSEKQQTGYIYVSLVNLMEATKALKLNNKPFRGTFLCIESAVGIDFNKISDSSDSCSSQLETPYNHRSPYYRDLCLAIINVSSEVNEKDVKDFLNVSLDNKRIHFIEKDEYSYCLINAVDERMMLKILSFNGAIFRFNTIKVIAISKHQFKAYLTTAKQESKREVVPNPLLAARKYLAESSKNVLSCMKFENLRVGTTVSDLAKLFSATIIPMNHIIINNSDAVVDFISAATCQNIMKDIKSRSDVDFTVTAITHGEFQILKSRYLSNPNGRKFVPNSLNKLPSNTSKPPLQPDKSRVKMKNLSPTVGNPQIKEFIRDFEYQPISIQICYANGRHAGEAILTFMNAMEAVSFKDEFHGKMYLQRELEVLLSDRN